MTKRYKECFICPYQNTNCPPYSFGKTSWETGKAITKSGCAFTSPNYGTPINYNMAVDGEEHLSNVEPIFDMA